MVKYSSYEINQAWDFIDARLNLYAKRLDREECFAIGCLAYVEARKTYEGKIGSRKFWAYVDNKIEMGIKQYRKERNERIRLCSPRSIYAPLNENGENLLSILPRKNGDFTKGVHLKMFLESLESKQKKICRLLIDKEEHDSIMRQLHLADIEYYDILWEIRHELMDYYEGCV